MTLTEAQQIAKNPEAYTLKELDDAMTVILEDDRLTETQVTNLLNKIDPVMQRRIAEKD